MLLGSTTGGIPGYPGSLLAATDVGAVPVVGVVGVPGPADELPAAPDVAVCDESRVDHTTASPTRTTTATSAEITTARRRFTVVLSVGSAKEGAEGHGPHAACRHRVEDVREGIDRASVAEVEAHDRPRLQST